jgi:metal-responsive CopG/Arc/MetJ family transcriptional regulator
MPKKSSSKSRPRAKGMTQISISLPETLVAKIDAMANAENRNRSNFISNEMVKRIGSHAKG